MSVSATPRLASIERVNTGSLFHKSSFNDPYNGRAKPRSVGDTLKVDISESMSASSTAKTKSSRENAIANKGPNADSKSGFLGSLLNLDAEASGSDSFTGDGSASSSSSFTGQIAASVINVLPNGNLVVAGERSIAMNGDIKTLRFSGIVDPRDLRPQNIVGSADVINAKLEVLGYGEASEAAQRSWLQRLLTNSLAVW
ncbi:flagellar basal body L-ring protein FlgH [Comamonas composti]|uniref:flagellar basal body L-ring protein FlgH n=1 Tax=Comamonas composti TaxID=408558 RepID=UPI000687D5DA|nr:flagellar basal body L-ring protein FlgH [Comamonas composti]